MNKFPQTKNKKIKSFLSRDSKTFLMSAVFVGTQFILPCNVTNAWHDSYVTNNYTTSTNPPSFYPYPADADVPANQSRSNSFVIVNSATCQHVSGVVNGHLSATPSVDLNQTNVTYTKTHTLWHASWHGSCCGGSR